MKKSLAYGKDDAKTGTKGSRKAAPLVPTKEQ